MKDLFNHQVKTPLAERLRPLELKDFVGQEDIIGQGKILRRILEKGRLESSIIFWGPPGCGKTTLAHLIANSVDAYFVFFSAVTSGVAEVRKLIAEADGRLKVDGQRTILFIDEIHRFNKAQQDAFLPHVEKGTIILIGATTENPSFEVISPLLSRCRTFILKALSEGDIEAVLRKALEDETRGYGKKNIKIPDEVLLYLVHLSYGDARTALNALEMAVESFSDESGGIILTRDIIEDSMQKRNLLYDKDGEQHFNLISALHKSLRGGDPDASIYWLARMLEGGEEPLYIARRLIRFASEDIGNADPDALSIAINAARTVEYIGLPECKLVLAQAAAYLAVSPKSNAVYKAYSEAVKDIKRHGALPVPLWLRNAPTSFMKKIGYGKGYLYPHDVPEGVVAQEYLPEKLSGRKYYQPVERGFEREIIKRMKYWRGLREGGKPEK